MTTILLPNHEATFQFGVRLGEQAVEGLCIAASGNLGTGKTTLAQGIAKGLGVPDDHYVNSPTFAILQIHPGRLAFNHIDLYRLGDIDEAYGIGLDEIVGVRGVSYVEWPGCVPELIPTDHLRLELSVDGAGRRLEVEAFGPVTTDFLSKCAITNA